MVMVECICGCGQTRPVTDKRRTRYIRGHNLRGDHFSRRGAASPSWKGGRRITEKGYVMLLVRDHPAANRDGYIFEHRLVMEATLGRQLGANEVVHHRNGNRADNTLINLQLMDSGQHSKYHLQVYPDERARKRAYYWRKKRDEVPKP